MQFMNDPELPEPNFPGSHMVTDENYLFISGLVAADLPNGDAHTGDVRSETAAVMQALQRMLESAGSSLSQVVRVDVHLADLDDIQVMDTIYARFFQQGRYPARTCTESPRLCGGCRIEVTMMAVRTPEH